MTPTPRHRETFRQVAGVFLPAWRDMPDGARLGIEGRQLDQALMARPALAAPLMRILDTLAHPVTATHVQSLHDDATSDFMTLRTLVCGAYYLHPDVRKELGYSGQQALTLSRGGFGGEELVMKMMEQPKRFRSV